jgi:hypothetical protein
LSKVKIYCTLKFHLTLEMDWIKKLYTELIVFQLLGDITTETYLCCFIGAQLTLISTIRF